MIIHCTRKLAARPGDEVMNKAVENVKITENAIGERAMEEEKKSARATATREYTLNPKALKVNR
jgi:hypothetical protein